VIVRQATAADAEGIAQITNQIIRDTLFTFTTQEKSPELVAAEIARKGARFQVAEEDGEILGFASLGAFRAGPGYSWTCEHTIYLAQGARGRGLGRTLIATIEDVARAEGIHVLVAGISAANAAAMAFHAAMGFGEVGRLPQVGRKAGQWLDLVLMQKILADETDAAPDSAARTG